MEAAGNSVPEEEVEEEVGAGRRSGGVDAAASKVVAD